jgi:phosphoribosylformylglycinamidine synthase
LLRNTNQQYVCKNIFIKNEADEVFKIPIAHGEGRYFADAATLDKLETNGQVLYRYCDENGRITQDANPNGSLRNIAGICNAGRNVVGMMPHPERACSSALENTDGMAILQSLIMAGQPVF